MKLSFLFLFALLAVSLNALQVATWNIQQLGPTKIGRSSVVDAIVQVITKYDIVFVQELKNSPDDQCGQNTGPVICKLFQQIQDKERSFNMNVSERVGSGGATEQYVVFYRQNKFSLLDSTIYDDTSGVFARPPHITTWKVASGGKFVAITIHTQPDNAREEIPELGTVVKSLFNPPQDVIVLGDYNADGKYFTPARDWPTLFSNLPSGYKLIVPDGMKTMVGTDNTYDRMVVSSHFASSVKAPVSALHVDEEIDMGPIKSQGCDEGWLDCGASDEEAAKKVSDHYPVIAKVDFTGNANTLNLVSIQKISVQRS